MTREESLRVLAAASVAPGEVIPDAAWVAANPIGVAHEVPS